MQPPDQRRKTYTNRCFMKKLIHDNLKAEILRLKEINKNQLRLNKKEVDLRQQAQQEAQGVKVMLAMLVQQQEGGVIFITDKSLQEFQFDLRIVYNHEKCFTTIMSNPGHNVLNKKT